MTLITETAALAEFCRRIAKSRYLTVDTEFLRERTYWPKLCVVQVAGDDDARAIDALADGIDLTPLFDLLVDESIPKVFHAARQDLEIFYHLTGRLPEPVFDTQIAAMVCGFGDSAGYETLVSKLTKVRIDKAARFTDWSARPLTKRQISYALSDVTHLRKVYERLQKKLNHNGRAGWLGEEIASLTSPETYDPDPRECFRRIKTRSNDPKFLAVLREVAAWRELEAQRLDLPRNHVLRDEALVEIAHHTPSSANELVRTRGLGRRLAEGQSGADIIAAVKAGIETPEADRPTIAKKPVLPGGLGPITDLLKVLLKMTCEKTGAAQKLVASVGDLELIAAFGEDADVAALRGWRREVFGEDALRLRRGETALLVKGRKLKAVPAKGLSKG
ncbi:MAG: ribonuclease D [Rhodospirillales bacterium]|nr:ribonuclease D [Rhodospirillales bacterium]